MRDLLGFILHIDGRLAAFIAEYGTWTYGLLFAIVFCETGLIVTPFLPGDSLLFAAGAFAGAGALDIVLLLALLFVAAVLGDAVNYWIGRKVGARIVARGSLFGLPVRREHVERTNRFYAKYGGKTLVIARFMPIVRTFAPFVAGVGGMEYRRFAVYNVLGAAVWVASFTLGGYFFGNIPAVKENFTLVILAIIVISVIPPVVEVVRARRETAPPVSPPPFPR